MRNTAKRQRAELDRRIEAIVYRRCSGLAINILKIGDVFAAGYAAVSAGTDLETAIVDTYTRLAERTGP